MHLNKVCDLEDFNNVDFLSVLASSFSRRMSTYSDWPRRREDRKFWEIAMALLSVKQCGALTDHSLALGVGAGLEPTSFILSNIFRWVFVTDLYGGNAWDRHTPSRMLVDPGAFADDLSFNDRRMVVQHMNASDLRYESQSFDFIYSSSSVEHFGSATDIARASSEMGRVLKPGGILSLSTELLLGGANKRLNDRTTMFTKEDLDRLIIEPSGCVPTDAIDLFVSGKTLATRTSFSSAMDTLRSSIGSRLDVSWPTYPHLVLQSHEAFWTSVHLCLRKPL